MYGKKPVDHPLGWLVAFGSFLVQFSVFGAMNSFTIFLDSMMNDETLSYPSQTTLSLGSSISMGLASVFGMVGGVLADRIHPKVLLSFAMAGIYAALLMSSYFAKSGIGVSLFFALPISLSAGMTMIPTAAATSTWFEKHRATAIGIVYAGGGCGSVVFPLFCGPFLGKYGWRSTFRILTLLVSSGVIGTLLVEKRSLPSQEVNEEELIVGSTMVTSFMGQRTFRNSHLKPKEVLKFIFARIFVASFVCQIFYSFAFYAAIYVCVPLALAMGKDGTVYQDEAPIDPGAAGRLITWFGIAQTIGSFSGGLISAHFGSEAVFCLCCSVTGIGFCFLALATTYIELLIALMVLALFASATLSTYSSILAHIFYGANLGTSMSLVFLGGCVSGFAGPPILSAMQGATNGDYTYGCILTSGFAVAAAYICYFLQWKDNYEVMTLNNDESTSLENI
ncbi:putative transporter [Trypanosoma theileri]|uniref:Putative transporter n=1 Tax=Trypanosoma theileri TaxID=67003 RepID=A0A1X0NKP2_9TRYP|nr:putative transporter [Trypanosoma theileri]ORC85033.1 putative transporter [Trypanosoma theileri]